MSDLDRIRRISGILGTSSGIEQVLEMIGQVAPVDISVLITGESGTGKEVVARAVHKLSRRANNSLVVVNCGAIPAGIIESELFGHKKGAFTGASDDRKGYFEEADKGTIFLDEIGETPIETQVKLLRVLETGEFMRVGDSKSRKTDVRIIAATNKNLRQEADKGNFRRDLYYRLRTVTINLPPLRQRIEDLEELAERFALQFSRSNDIIFRGFTSDAYQVMKQYDWQGNIRELRNFVESIILLERGNRISSDIVLKHLAVSPDESSHNLPVLVDKSASQAERELILQQLLFLRQDMRDLKATLGNESLDRSGEVGILKSRPALDSMVVSPTGEIQIEAIKSSSIGDVSMKELEKEMIVRTLKKYNNNRRKTAELLGISERTLYRKINEYGIEKKHKRNN
jgi:DNA-binding NtrC family response regulator